MASRMTTALRTLALLLLGNLQHSDRISTQGCSKHQAESLDLSRDFIVVIEFRLLRLKSNSEQLAKGIKVLASGAGKSVKFETTHLNSSSSSCEYSH
jgi:hypothetical protein